MSATTQPLAGSHSEPHAGDHDQRLARIQPATLALMGILLLAALLNFANIDAIGDANTYYTAAVEAMLQSPSNFFFAAAEPGGSVSVDKPPLGLWLQAISAFLLGVNGFAVVLLQLLAGIFAVPLLYHLVKRQFGSGAGLVAALVMATMPVTIAVQRNNTMDATLIFTLLLAAWAFIRATETGKLKWLVGGAVLVGLGFNIKMLQAFLPLPAFYALYFLSAPVTWRRKVVQLAVTTGVLLAVSFSWIIAVDLTPADQRPYVGSSDSNSALELAIGYNGLQRLLGMDGGGGPNGAPGGALPEVIAADGAQTTPFAGDAGLRPPPPGGMGQPYGAMQSAGNTPPTLGADGPGAGGVFVDEIGTAGVLRLVAQPLDNENGWLLPFGLFSIGLLLVAARPRLPLPVAHQAVILWGGWLLTEVVFFSAAGFFHAYYLAMLTPPLAAMVGIGVMRLWEIRNQRQLLGTALLIGAVGATLALQIGIATRYSESLVWVLIPAAALLAGSGILLAARFVPRVSRFAAAGLVCLVMALTAVPAVWAGMTTASPVHSALPAAYSGDRTEMRGNPPMITGQADQFGAVNPDLVAFLQANTEGMRYMLAVSSSMQGAVYVLETGRGVLYMGGFNGQDPVVDAEALQALVDAGELRYVLTGGGMPGGMIQTDSQISTWLRTSCTAVSDISTSGGTLVDCAQ